MGGGRGLLCCVYNRGDPMSNELGTYTPVKARFWSGRLPFFERKSVNPFRDRKAKCFSALLSTEVLVVGLSWAELKPKGPKGQVVSFPLGSGSGSVHRKAKGTTPENPRGLQREKS